MKKARRERNQRHEEPEEGRNTLAVSQKDLPSTSRRGGRSLQEWLQQYWPTYFQEVKNKDSVAFLSDAGFEKDFLDKMETYLKSTGPANKIPKSPGGSQRKRDLRATGAIPKKLFVAASRGHTNESSKNRSLRTVTLRRNDYKNVFCTNKTERKTKKIKVISVVKPKAFNENEGIVLKKMTRKNGGYFPQQEDGKEGGCQRNAKIFIVQKKREDLSNRDETTREKKPRLVIAKSSKTETHRNRLPTVKKRKAPSPPASPKEQQQRIRVILKGKEAPRNERFSSQIAEKAKELTQRYSQEHNVTRSDLHLSPRPQPGRGHPFPEDNGPSWRRFSAADMMAFAEVGARRSHEVGVSAGMRSVKQVDAPGNAASGVKKDEEKNRSHIESECEAAPQQGSEARRSSLVSSPNDVASMTSGDSFFDIADDYVREKLAEIMYSTSLSDVPSNVLQPENAEDGSCPYDTKDKAHFHSTQPNDTHDPPCSSSNRESFRENPFLLLHPGGTLDDSRSADTRFDAREEESMVAGSDREQFASRPYHERRPAPAVPSHAAQTSTRPSDDLSEVSQGLTSGLEFKPKEFSNFPYTYTVARPKKYFTTFFGLSPDNHRTGGLQPSTTGFIQPQEPSSDNHARMREADLKAISGEGSPSFSSYVLPGPQPLFSDLGTTKCVFPSADSLPDGAETSECSRVGPRPPALEQWDRDVEACFSSEDFLFEESHRKRRPIDEGNPADWAPVEDLSHDESFLSFVRSYKMSSRGEKDGRLGNQRRPASSDVSGGNLNEFLAEDISLALSDVRRPQNVARVMSQGELDFGRPTRVRYASAADAPPVPPRSPRGGSTAVDYVNGSFLRRLGVRTRVTRSRSFGGWGIRGHFKDVASLGAQFRVDGIPPAASDCPPRMALMQTRRSSFTTNTSTQTTLPRLRRRRGSDCGIDIHSEGLKPLHESWQEAQHPAFARRSLISLLKTPGGPTAKGLSRTRKTVAFSEITDDEDDHKYDAVESDSSLSSCGALASPRCPKRSHSCRLWYQPARRGSYGNPASLLRRRARSYESVVDARRERGGHDYPAKSGIREYMQLREIIEIQKVAWKKWKKEERERRRRAKKMLAKEASVQYSEILWPRQEGGEDPRNGTPRVPELHEARNPRLAVDDGEEAAATPAPGRALGPQEGRGSAAGGPGL